MEWFVCMWDRFGFLFYRVDVKILLLCAFFIPISFIWGWHHEKKIPWHIFASGRRNYGFGSGVVGVQWSPSLDILLHEDKPTVGDTRYGSSTREWTPLDDVDISFSGDNRFGGDVHFYEDHDGRRVIACYVDATKVHILKISNSQSPSNRLCGYIFKPWNIYWKCNICQV